jgi:roundabout, axon guidance receptor 2
MNKFLILTIITIIINITSINASKSPPKIEQNPLSLIVNVSDPVTLQCGATGDPKPKITWYRDGHQLNIVSKSESTIMNTGVNNKYTLIHDSNLFIISAALGKGNKSDTGVYYCKAQNEHGEAISSNASLIITYLKDDFREIPKSRQVNAGSQVIMECKAPRGFPEPIIWWEKNNVQLYQSKDVYVFSNGTFAIVNASIKDNGEYVCVARNEAGIKRSQPAFLNVFEKPWFTIQPETAKYQANTKVELECQANGFPKPVIEWKKDNSIDNLPLKSQIRDNILIIPNIQLEDEGEYTCVASNQLATIEAKSYLIVYEKPTFTKTMPNVTVGFESKSITIECNARGKPQPVIYWAKSTQMASSASSSSNLVAEKRQGNADDFIILENGNLFIERLSKKYEGTYLCQASNEYGNTETKTYLQVKSIQSKPPPIVIYGPQNQTIPINTQATLECLTTIASNTLINNNLNMANSQQQQQQQYELNEKIVVTWFKGTKQINDIPNFETTKYRVLDTGSLEINSVQK